MQVYRFMDIGTAKPTPEQRARVPHHLLDVVTPDVPLQRRPLRGGGAPGRGRASTRAADRRPDGRHRPLHPSVPRGSDRGRRRRPGAARARSSARTRGRRAEGDPQRLHRRLRRSIPKRAARIHPNDARRIIRALEIVQHTGQPSAWLRDGARASPTARIACSTSRSIPARETLDRRIDARCAAMIEAGLLHEVRELCERRLRTRAAPMQAIGYRHMMPVVEGADTLRNALAAMQRDTRHFARRQRTWLRGVPEARWIDPAARDAIVATVEAFLRGGGRPARLTPCRSSAELDVQRRRVGVDQRLAALDRREERVHVRVEEEQADARQQLEHAGDLADRTRADACTPMFQA